jgi:hypothetical protein
MWLGGGRAGRSVGSSFVVGAAGEDGEEEAK